MRARAMGYRPGETPVVAQGGDTRDVFSVYDRKNARAYTYNVRLAGGSLVPERTTESLLPILPTFGVSIEF